MTSAKVHHTPVLVNSGGGKAAAILNNFLMDVNVAVVQLRQADKSVLGGSFDAATFDVLLTDVRGAGSDHRSSLDTLNRSPLSRRIENSPPIPARTSDANAKQQRQLPRCRMNFEQEPSDVALSLVRRLALPTSRSRLWRRAVSVGLARNESPNSSISGSNDVFHSNAGALGLLYCIPVLEKDKHLFNNGNGAKVAFYNLAKLLELCQNHSAIIDAESRHMIVRLEEWLRERQQSNQRFLSNLFVRPAAFGRIRSCVHNPAHPDESRSCAKIIGRVNGPGGAGVRSSDLAEEVRRANDARARMMAVEKCDVFIMNPLFASGLPYCINRSEQLVNYFAKNRPEAPSPPHRGLQYLREQSSYSSHENSADSSASWAEEYPMHRHAYLGHEDKIKTILNQGADPNQRDRDSWTPLHYAAWYGQLGAVQALISYGNCDVNARNRNGSSAMHFAAWGGHLYVVELLLSHPAVVVECKDKDGKTPLDLCDCVPKPDWQSVASLLRAAATENLPKIQVDLMDGSNAMLSLLNGPDTTSAQLHLQMCNELALSPELGRLFCIWICSSSLELQLKMDHKPVSHIQRWKTKILPKWSDSPDPNTEEPRLVFRRDARAPLVDERKVKLTDASLALLYDEARHNYIRGLYPCSDHDTVMLAAIMLQIVHGNYDSKRDKQLLSNERTLRMLVPEHKLKSAKSTAGLVSKIIAEHKHVSQKGAKNISGLQYQFLSFCWNLRVYGSAFFDAMVFVSKPTSMKGALQVHVGVNDCGLHLINVESKTLFQSYALNHIEWQHQGDRPYVELKTKNQHMFTLRTRQASHINMLLNKLVEKSK